MTLYEMQCRMTYAEFMLHLGYESIQYDEMRAANGQTEIKPNDPEDLHRIMEGYFGAAADRTAARKNK